MDSQGSIALAAHGKKLTSGQRHYLYRLGLLAVDEFMRGRGFVPNSSENTQVLSYEKGPVLIDIALKEPQNIAFVTSGSGYKPDAEKEIIGTAADGQKMYKVKASVTRASDILGADLLVQVMVGDARGTCKPVYVPLPKNIENPARYVVENVLGILRAAADALPSIKESFQDEACQEVIQDAARLMDTAVIPEHIS